jgi:hypothetical protein
VLSQLLRQSYSTFAAQYDRAAQRVDADLAGSYRETLTDPALAYHPLSGTQCLR